MAMLVPVVAAVLCLEIAVAFLVIHRRFGRRLADLVFAVLALALGWMALSSYLTNIDIQRPQALFWLRNQYVGVVSAVTLFLHLALLVSGLRRSRRGIALTYLLGVLMVGLVFTDSFVLVSATPGRWFNIGPLFRWIMPLLLLEAVIAWVVLMRGWRRRHEVGFAPLQARLPVILAGMAVAVLDGFIVVILILFFPETRVSVSLHSLGAALFCVFCGVALAQELIRSEGRRAKLEQLVRFRDEAVRDVAHELKNPLAGIQGAAKTLLALPVPPEAQREMLGLCVETCGRLMRLLHNMLDTARLEAGREPDLRLEPTDLPALARSVIEAQKLATDRHTFELHSDLAQPLREVDGDKLYQILTNLVNNAVKYSPAGGLVSVRLSEAGAELRIAVTDEGLGLTPEQAGRVFEPFERLTAPERKITGTGVGLHLVRRLAEVHGGWISVVSQPGTGSTFTLHLPRPEAPPD
ncbi:MAG: hypothetical protein IT204_12975 [Fimbriimonadaceae bacterium]|nr:hypothetical protein [Fimbriimonadaceae bacterium]